MKTTFVSLFTLLILSLSTTAQVTQPKRVEVETQKQYYNFSVTPIENKKLFVSYTDFNDDKTFTKHFQLRDKDLGVTKKNSIKFGSEFKPNKTYTISSYDNEKDLFYYLFQNRKKGNYSLLTINMKDLSYKKLNGMMPKKTYPSKLHIIGKRAYYTFHSKKGSVLYSIDLKSGENKIYTPKDIVGKKSGISGMQTVGHGDKKELWVAYYTQISSHHQNKTVIRFDINNKELSAFKLNDTDDRKHLDLTSSPSKDGGYFVYGTYNSKNRKGTSEGVYLAKVSASGKLKFVDYTNFLDLENYTSYLSEKRKDKIEKKKSKKEKHGKELKLKQLMTIHEIIEQNGQYILIGEGYYKTYRTEYYTDSQGNRHSRQVFDGYQYSHAVAIGFSTDGKMMWNQTFSMWVAYKPFYVKQFLTASEDGKQLKLMYATGSMLKSISLMNGKTISDKSVEIIDTKHVDDKVKYTSGHDVEFWYGKHFISYGYQKIKNKKDKSVDKKRFIYYINKIEFL